MRQYLIAGALIIIAFVLGMYSRPAEIKTKVVEKVVTVEKEIKKDKTKIVKKEVITKDKDGNLKIVRDYTQDTTTYENKKSETEIEKKSESSTSNHFNNLISLHRQFSNTDQINHGFILGYQRRLFSSLYVGGYVQPDKDINYGLSITLGF